MRVEFERNAMVEVLSGVTRVVPKQAIRPILQGVHLRAEGETLVASATDTQVQIAVECKATVQDAGDLAVPARLLLQLLQRCGDGIVRLESGQSDGTLEAKLQWGKFKANVPAYPGDFPVVEWPEQWAVAQGLREAMLTAASCAAEGDQVRPLLKGVYVGKHRAVATTGFRVAMLEQPEIQAEEMTVPTALVELVAAVTAKNAVEMSVEGPRIAFRSGAVRVGGRLLEGEYPHVWDIVPKEYEARARFSRATLLPALERLAVVTAAEPPHVVDLSVDGTVATLKAESARNGSGEETVEVLESSGTIKLCVNAVQLIDGCKLLGGAEVRLEVKDAVNITRWTGEDASFAYYQMPLDTGEDAETGEASAS